MNCPSDEFIQMIIDGEVPETDTRLLSHVKSCSICAERLAEQQELARSVKESMNSVVGDLPETPAFMGTKMNRRQSAKMLYRIIIPLAAASILFLFFISPFGKGTEEPVKVLVLSGVDGEIDANLPLSDQEIEIFFYDENGRLIQ